MSETIKVLCYKSKTLSNGEHPLMVCVCKDGKRKYQSLGLSIKMEQWDFKTNQPKAKCPNRERIILLINEKINEIQKVALDKRIAGKDFTAATQNSWRVLPDLYTELEERGKNQICRHV